jgi:hypothetical protein
MKAFSVKNVRSGKFVIGVVREDVFLTSEQISSRRYESRAEAARVAKFLNALEGRWTYMVVDVEVAEPPRAKLKSTRIVKG